jgi:hypothetical protein
VPGICLRDPDDRHVFALPRGGGMRRSSLVTPRSSVARRVRSTRVRGRDALAARYAATPRPQVSDRFDGSPDCAAADLAPLPQQPRSKTPSTLADRRSLCASSGGQAGRSAAQLTAPRHLCPDFRRSQAHTGLIVSVCAGQRVDGPRWSCVGVGTRESVCRLTQRTVPWWCVGVYLL